MTFTAPDINLQAISTFIILLISAIVLVLLPLFRPAIKRGMVAAIALTGFILAFAATIMLWNQDLNAFGNMVRLDNFALTFNLIFLISGMLTVLISLNRIEDEYLNFGEFFSLIQFTVLGMMIMSSTNNLLVIFLGLETLSIALYVLSGIRKMRADSIEASLKYFLLGAFATGFLLYGIAFWYGATGSLDLSAISTIASASSTKNIYLVTGAVLILVGLSFKAAFVPFHLWTPDVYQGAPTPVTAFMSTATKAVAFAVLMRLAGSAYPYLQLNWNAILAILSVLTMTLGNFMAIQQNNVKRMLAYSSIAHAGYLLVAVVAANEAGQNAVFYYLIVYTLMNIGAFGVLSYMGYSNKQENLAFADYNGLGYRFPFASLAMSVFMFSLAGIPPTGGFMAKFYIFRAGVDAGYIPLVIIAVLNSVVSVYFYLRVVIHLYMKDSEKEVMVIKAGASLSVALFIALLGVLQTGVAPSLLFDFLRQSVLK